MTSRDADWRNEKLAALRAAFTPASPIDAQAFFAGRRDQYEKVIGATLEKGQHVVVFGERGVGKTSLANVVSVVLTGVHEKIPEQFLASKVTCTSEDDFSSVWNKALGQLPAQRSKKTVGFDRNARPSGGRLSDGLPDEGVTPDDVCSLLRETANERSVVIVIDEFDRLKDPIVGELFADTIKVISDNSLSVTLILVGVASDVADLVAGHASVSRALFQVHMPRMSPEELREILVKGLGYVGLTMEPRVSEQIVRISQGLPHFTHLLALYAGMSAVNGQREHVTSQDLDAAIHRAVERTEQTIADEFHRATSSPRKDSLYGKVLLACALAEVDFLGYFAPSDVRGPMSRIMGRKYEIASFVRHLNEFCADERGAILERTGGARNYRYRFRNPLLQPYVVMHGTSQGILKS